MHSRWAITDAALASVADLLCRLHRAGAAAGFDPQAAWPGDFADPAGGELLCHNDTSAAALNPGEPDVPARLRIFADGYGLPRRERARLPEVVEQATGTCRAFVARRVADGDPVFTRVPAERGGWERWDRIQEWPAAHRELFRHALLS